MKTKKIMSVVAASCLMVSLCAMPAMAHHGNGHHRSSQITYTVCNVEGCSLTYNHIHNGQYCYGHSLNDGHDYHEACTIAGCTETGVHYHNDNCYFGCSQGRGGHCGGGC